MANLDKGLLGSFTGKSGDMVGSSWKSKIVTSCAKKYEGTYYGGSSDGENLGLQAYPGGTFIEIPLDHLCSVSIFLEALLLRSNYCSREQAHQFTVGLPFIGIIDENPKSGFEPLIFPWIPALV